MQLSNVSDPAASLLPIKSNQVYFLCFQLDDLRNLVRGKLTSRERQVLSALIVIEVHARDVVMNMVAENVSNLNDFEWISQLRLA